MPIVTAALCVILTVAMAWSWLGRVKLPARKSSVAVVTLVAGLSAGAFLYADIDDTAHYLTLIGALGVVLAFLTQMLRRSRERITESISSTVAALCVALLVPGWVLVMRHGELAIACAAATAFALLAVAAPLPTTARFAAAALGGGAVAAVAPMVMVSAPFNYMIAVLGVMLGVAAHATSVVLTSLIAKGPLPLPSGATSATVIEALRARQPKHLSFPESLALSTGQLGVASILVFIAAYALT
ncbi:hypothetical protein JT358_00650 [Micrococcales bacterium 31B]|nr:hypothetical protein [Micrococcales bacterium 31B]